DDNDKNNPDKLIISLPETIKKDTSLSLIINYSAGFDLEKKTLGKPRSGFHFITHDERHCSNSFQTWTQGEANESRYWFPCVEDPQVKFPREIHVTVPEDYIVISNGVKEIKHLSEDSNQKECEWIWKQSEPISTYLTSIVIGKFKNKTIQYQRNGHDKGIPLEYYWSEEVERRNYDPMLTYGDTPNYLKFIEEYLGVDYPYEKYSQVAVEDFDYGGMENASCTTLEGEVFHDKNALPNYTFDDVVVIHELAHQWFGDLVTCKDWSHLWLNEGFATYFESLYLDKEYVHNNKTKSRDEFYYYVITSIFDVYISESLQYKRPIVTKVYKHPDDLLDGHTYQKGGSILHMLRSEIGDENFSNSLKNYLTSHRNKSVETDDLRKFMEDESGISLERFFDQWVYRKGHPVLDIDLILSKDELKVVVKQINPSITNQNLTKQGILVNDPKAIEPLVDEQDVFEFPLEVKLYFANSEPKLFKLNIDKNNYEYSIKLEKGYEERLQFISIDPELKILKEINSYKVEDQVNEDSNKKFSSLSMLMKQLKHGETVVERIDAARLLPTESPSKDTINSIKDSIVNDPFYGVSLESINTITSYADSDKISEEEIRKYVYRTIESFFVENKILSVIEDKRIISSLITSFSQFKKFHNKKSLDLVKSFVNNQNWFIARSAIAAIGKIANNLTLKEKEKEKEKESSLSLQEKKEIIEFLKDFVNKERNDNNEIEHKSFRNLLARGAINGLQNFASDPEEKIILDIANFLISCSSYGNDFLIRRDTITALGDFLRYKIKDKGNDKDIERFNNLVFNHLENVIKSPRFGLQTRVCQALVKKLPEKPDNEIIKTLEILTWIAEHDTDGSVRREAEVSINQIRKRMKEWLEQPIQLESKIRQEREKLHEKIMEVRSNRLNLY
ncbi:MAG TPA: M1 family metallopeptidase, partial [Nitrososphaeraceae archaeon]|nr:M1 family metallopeptidase [Nitrososphaeraceae archaeon]